MLWEREPQTIHPGACIPHKKQFRITNCWWFRVLGVCSGSVLEHSYNVNQKGKIGTTLKGLKRQHKSLKPSVAMASNSRKALRFFKSTKKQPFLNTNITSFFFGELKFQSWVQTLQTLWDFDVNPVPFCTRTQSFVIKFHLVMLGRD